MLPHLRTCSKGNIIIYREAFVAREYSGETVQEAEAYLSISGGLGVPVSQGLPVGSPALPTQASHRRPGSSQAKYHTHRSPRSASKSSMSSLKNALSKARYKTAFISILSRSDKAFDAFTMFTDLVGHMWKREIISKEVKNLSRPGWLEFHNKIQLGRCFGEHGTTEDCYRCLQRWYERQDRQEVSSSIKITRYSMCAWLELLSLIHIWIVFKIRTATLFYKA